MKIDKYISGKFLAHTDIDGDTTITFLDEGIGDTTEFKGKTKEVVVFEVKLSSGEKKIYTPNITSMRKLAERWGVETKEWIGNVAKLIKIEQLVAGELKWIIIAQPTDIASVIDVNEEKIDKEYEAEEGVNVKDIPF